MKFGEKKLKNSIKKEFYSEPVYNEKYPKAKIKSYNGKINTNFHKNKILKEGSQFICLSVILINSVFRMTSKNYPQVFLECKFVVKERKMTEYTTADIEFTSDSDQKTSHKKILIKEILIMKILRKSIKYKMHLFFIFKTF